LLQGPYQALCATRGARYTQLDFVVGCFSFLSAPRANLPLRGARTEGTMPPPPAGGSSRRDPSDQGRLAASISAAVVHVFSEHTGRGPTRARTTIDGQTVVVILQDGMTKAERSLAQAGKDKEVLQLRRSFQDTMSSDLITVVERLTSAGVQAFMSANHIEPDAAAEIFLLDRKLGTVAEGSRELP
jgi:uncharacterized protein YbcI